jgi:hypothetical protein
MNECLDIRPLHDDFRYCLEDTVVSVASWMGRHYELMYAEDWGFDFDYEKYKSGDMLSKCITPQGGDICELLKRYHGMEIVRYDSIENDTMIKIVESELKESRPVILEFDWYYCPWNEKAARKYHVNHISLIVGYDSKNKTFHITDCYYKMQDIVLPVEYLEKLEKNIAVFKLLPLIPEDNHWRGVLTKALDKIQNTKKQVNTFDMIRNFAGVIEQLDDLNSEFAGYDEVLTSPLLTTLSSISHNRNHFAEVLYYIGKEFKMESIYGLVKDMKSSALQWDIACSLLSMTKYKTIDNKRLMNRAVKKIKSAADLEETVANSLAAIL